MSTQCRWKLSQIISLSFIALILGFALFGGLFGPSDGLMSDARGL